MKFPVKILSLALPMLAPAQITSFQHVIVIVQENRTPDNLFQGLCATSRNQGAMQRHPERHSIQHPNQ